MRIRRRLLIPLIVLLIVAGVALIVTLRKHAPPEAARLLPGADGFFYINLRWIRTFNATGQLPSVSREPEYQKFVEETGFQFERDLDKAAFAIHYPQSWGNGTAGSAAEPRFSEIFVGKIDSGRLTAYLKKLSSSIEDYRGFDIYNIPFEGRMQIRRALEEGGINHQTFEVNGAHAFIRDEGPRYDPAAAQIGYGMALELFKRLSLIHI